MNEFPSALLNQKCNNSKSFKKEKSGLLQLKDDQPSNSKL
jgi:hypothetical protein